MVLRDQVAGGVQTADCELACTSEGLTYAQPKRQSAIAFSNRLLALRLVALYRATQVFLPSGQKADLSIGVDIDQRIAASIAVFVERDRCRVIAGPRIHSIESADERVIEPRTCV